MIQKQIIDTLMDPEVKGTINNLISALNFNLPQQTQITVTGNTLLTDLQVQSGVLLLTGSPGAGFNLTLPATTDITRRISGALPLDGTCHVFLEVVNETGQTATIVAGDASTTLLGTVSVPTGQMGRFLITLTSGIAVSIKRYGVFNI